MAEHPRKIKENVETHENGAIAFKYLKNSSINYGMYIG